MKRFTFCAARVTRNWQHWHGLDDLLGPMFKEFEFCLPTKATTVPTDPDWLHEVNRLRLERDGDRVHLIPGGHDWTKRYPWIVEAARMVCQKRFALDGEAVVLGVDGVSDFNAFHSGKCKYGAFPATSSACLTAPFLRR